MKVQKTKLVADLNAGQCIIRMIAPSLRDMGDVQKAIDEIVELMTSHETTLLVLNFARVKMLSSSFLGKLMGLRKQLADAKVPLRLCCLSTEVEQAFKICRMEKMFPVFKTEADALKG